ncbi:unnamed protein product [Microthlaspi erraticum]|uniref:Uncharacterized protein n=1 Tax=Microthlaspi erraticum TaxID=1685480 RepID=A0A6D2L133_9BRAS|nr:unnamed protein product [Microthlaspi erraticum]
MEEEKNKELVALAEEKEKMREQKMANESKEAELAMMQAKIRMEEENNKQVAALAEEKEKVREQKMANESKEAELAAMQDKLQMEEKLRMEEEENKQLAALTEENEKLREQNMVIESKFLAEAELEVLQVKFQMEQEKNKQLIALVEEESRLKEQHRNEPKKTGVVYARNLCIEWGQDSRYWSWVTLQYDISSNALVEAAALLGVCWLDVGGTFDTRELTPWTHYEVVFVMKLRKSASGWEVPVHMKLVMPNSMPGPEERIVKLKDYIGKGWVTILAGEFLTTPEYLGEIRFSMYETNRWQEGLIIKGVIIRPKN